jgi:hypothetical protein
MSGIFRGGSEEEDKGKDRARTGMHRGLFAAQPGNVLGTILAVASLGKSDRLLGVRQPPGTKKRRVAQEVRQRAK